MPAGFQGCCRSAVSADPIEHRNLINPHPIPSGRSYGIPLAESGGSAPHREFKNKLAATVGWNEGASSIRNCPASDP
jgi:hypothetical protein